jgi:hypothetical protein
MTDISTTKLAAFGPEDLEVLSAHLQDAVMRVGDIRWMKPEGKLALVANRYDHLSDDGTGKPAQRRLAGLQFSRVTRVSANRIRMQDKTAVLSLLAITFEPGQTPPEGAIVLTFAGGGTVRVEVECIEAAMADLGPAWAARARPQHGIDGNDGDGAA